MTIMDLQPNRQSSLFNNQFVNTPTHNYYTRSVAKLLPRSAVQTYVPDGSGDHNDDCESRSSVATSNYFDSPSSILGCSRPKRINANRMDFNRDPCPPSSRVQFLRKAFVIVIIAVVGFYVNDVRMRLNSVKSEVDSINSRISDIVDARLDTLYQLSEVSNLVKDLKQTQHNFEQTIKKRIEHEINKMYTDKTGRTDFALESAGGRIVQLIPGTENYGPPKSSLLGISLCEGMHGPRAMIQTGTAPGECWALKGSSGGVIVKLLGHTKIDAVSMEHISKTISPSGDITTAPKDFAVWGLRSANDDRRVSLGQFSYNVDGPLVQTFPVETRLDGVYSHVELRVLTNHGNDDFTCVYRFRVHGVLEKSLRGK